ncbi:MAG: spore germination protein, partial [Oscillospiraceae bacterium]|nr:spore germination protein [Oscillospiraceae bacterium]
MNMPDAYAFKEVNIEKSLRQNISNIKNILGGSSDLLINEFIIDNTPCCLVCFEGMISIQFITNLILRPLTNLHVAEKSTPHDIFLHVRDRMLLAIDRGLCTQYGD